jgi:hypothetical protein
VAILAACGLLALLGWPLYVQVQRRKGRVPLLPGLLSMVAGVVGIVGLVLLYVYPAPPYAGPLGGARFCNCGSRWPSGTAADRHPGSAAGRPHLVVLAAP